MAANHWSFKVLTRFTGIFLHHNNLLRRAIKENRIKIAKRDTFGRYYIYYFFNIH